MATVLAWSSGRGGAGSGWESTAESGKTHPVQAAGANGGEHCDLHPAEHRHHSSGSRCHHHSSRQKALWSGQQMQMIPAQPQCQLTIKEGRSVSEDILPWTCWGKQPTLGSDSWERSCFISTVSLCMDGSAASDPISSARNLCRSCK